MSQREQICFSFLSTIKTWDIFGWRNMLQCECKLRKYFERLFERRVIFLSVTCYYKVLWIHKKVILNGMKIRLNFWRFSAKDSINFVLFKKFFLWFQSTSRRIWQQIDDKIEEKKSFTHQSDVGNKMNWNLEAKQQS